MEPLRTGSLFILVKSYPYSSAALMILARVSVLTPALLLSAMETAVADIPSLFASSFAVTAICIAPFPCKNLYLPV